MANAGSWSEMVGEPEPASAAFGKAYANPKTERRFELIASPLPEDVTPRKGTQRGIIQAMQKGADAVLERDNLTPKDRYGNKTSPYTIEIVPKGRDQQICMAKFITHDQGVYDSLLRGAREIQYGNVRIFFNPPFKPSPNTMPYYQVKMHNFSINASPQTVKLVPQLVREVTGGKMNVRNVTRETVPFTQGRILTPTLLLDVQGEVPSPEEAIWKIETTLADGETISFPLSYLHPKLRKKPPTHPAEEPTSPISKVPEKDEGEDKDPDGGAPAPTGTNTDTNTGATPEKTEPTTDEPTTDEPPTTDAKEKLPLLQTPITDESTTDSHANPNLNKPALLATPQLTQRAVGTANAGDSARTPTKETHMPGATPGSERPSLGRFTRTQAGKIPPVDYSN